jgi:hypothetical protein
MATLPFALTGGIWLVYLLGYDFSVATGVGFIALAGVAAEFGVVMLIYLKRCRSAIDRGETPTPRSVEAGARRRAAARAAQGDDGRGDPGRPCSRSSWTGGAGVGGHAPHRRADDRRHAHRAALVDVR